MRSHFTWTSINKYDKEEEIVRAGEKERESIVPLLNMGSSNGEVREVEGGDVEGSGQGRNSFFWINK